MCQKYHTSFECTRSFQKWSYKLHFWAHSVMHKDYPSILAICLKCKTSFESTRLSLKSVIKNQYFWPHFLMHKDCPSIWTTGFLEKFANFPFFQHQYIFFVFRMSWPSLRTHWTEELSFCFHFCLYYSTVHTGPCILL